jgi:hypothetical protein
LIRNVILNDVESIRKAAAGAVRATRATVAALSPRMDHSNLGRNGLSSSAFCLQHRSGQSRTALNAILCGAPVVAVSESLVRTVQGLRDTTWVHWTNACLCLQGSSDSLTQNLADLTLHALCMLPMQILCLGSSGVEVCDLMNRLMWDINRLCE